VNPHPLSGTRVLVIGAAGFLGSRLVERLVCECRADVRVLVRRVMSAAVTSRFPIDIVVGDITRPADVSVAVRGCGVVFNCVKGSGPDPALRRAADVDGARIVVEAAAAAGARIVHVSTMAVYDRPSDGDFDERFPAAPAGDLYTDTKIAGERTAVETGARLGAHVTVVQPTVIYGPNAGVYGRDILQEMHTHRLVLVDGGRGICNAVYIDDAVSALLLAATKTTGRGDRFLISGPEHPTWQQFLGSFEEMLGGTRTVALPESDALTLWSRSRQRRWLLSECGRILRDDPGIRRRVLSTREGSIARGLVRKVFPEETRRRLRSAPSSHGASAELPIAAVRPWVVRNMARRARARIDKARSVLGYTPVFSLADGMHLTRAWAQWAGLADSSDHA